jgi:DNA-binding transcriptional ArsR family regulator/uncharacterized protein YndB with AHSA1/START domain
MTGMDEIFRALADPTRRLLLDMLRAEDGQTLSQLEQRLTMTRFGVMKHLNILEDANLISTRKVGREKFHHLNPVPIQQISDRWISRYAMPFAQTMIDLKTAIEGKTSAMPNTAPKQVYEIFIKGTPEQIWDAMTDGTKTPLYYYGAKVASAWRKDAPMTYHGAEGNLMIAGKVIEAKRPFKLVTTFRAVWQESFKDDRPSRVTWEITPIGELCKLTLIHDDFDEETATFKATAGGWSRILSGLKTLVETGKPITAAA